MAIILWCKNDYIYTVERKCIHFFHKGFTVHFKERNVKGHDVIQAIQ